MTYSELIDKIIVALEATEGYRSNDGIEVLEGAQAVVDAIRGEVMPWMEQSLDDGTMVEVYRIKERIKTGEYLKYDTYQDITRLLRLAGEQQQRIAELTADRPGGIRRIERELERKHGRLVMKLLRRFRCHRSFRCCQYIDLPTCNSPEETHYDWTKWVAANESTEP